MRDVRERWPETLVRIDDYAAVEGMTARHPTGKWTTAEHHRRVEQQRSIRSLIGLKSLPHTSGQTRLADSETA